MLYLGTPAARIVCLQGAGRASECDPLNKRNRLVSVRMPHRPYGCIRLNFHWRTVLGPELHLHAVSRKQVVHT